jgi:hypothetical protein
MPAPHKRFPRSQETAVLMLSNSNAPEMLRLYKTAHFLQLKRIFASG